jgi:secondary thiamine-phosphate synthase enzyme
MIIKNYEIKLKAKTKGFHLVTDEIVSNIDISDISIGTINLFLQHTSASLTINENCDPSVRVDMENFCNDIVDENKPYFTHTYEGLDDMPAHIKSSFFGVSVTIPIRDGRLDMGRWQGVYLGEHRDHGGSRSIVATIYGK